MKMYFLGEKREKNEEKKELDMKRSVPDATNSMRASSVTCLQESDKLLFCTTQLLHIKGKAGD